MVCSCAKCEARHVVDGVAGLYGRVVLALGICVVVEGLGGRDQVACEYGAGGQES